MMNTPTDQDDTVRLHPRHLTLLCSTRVDDDTTILMGKLTSEWCFDDAKALFFGSEARCTLGEIGRAAL